MKNIEKQSVAAQAKAEVNAELRAEAVSSLKEKYRERAGAQTILDNIDREIVDLEQAAEQGNIG